MSSIKDPELEDLMNKVKKYIYTFKDNPEFGKSANLNELPQLMMGYASMLGQQEFAKNREALEKANEILAKRNLWLQTYLVFFAAISSIQAIPVLQKLLGEAIPVLQKLLGEAIPVLQKLLGAG